MLVASEFHWTAMKGRCEGKNLRTATWYGGKTLHLNPHKKLPTLHTTFNSSSIAHFISGGTPIALCKAHEKASRFCYKSFSYAGRFECITKATGADAPHFYWFLSRFSLSSSEHRWGAPRQPAYHLPGTQRRACRDTGFTTGHRAGSTPRVPP